MTTDNFYFYLQNRLIQASQTRGQWYSDASSFSMLTAVKSFVLQSLRLTLDGSHSSFDSQQCLLEIFFF